MTDTTRMARAAAPLLTIIRAIEPDQLGTPTPCAEYDVRRLVNHLLFWGPSLEAAAGKHAVPPPAGAESDVDLTEGAWSEALASQIDRSVKAWSTPGAWAGLTHMGGPIQLPSSLVGGMIVGEFVVHGWDLARATGLPGPEWDDDLLGYLHEEVATNAAQGREMGVYGHEVTVHTSAPMLERILGLTGRDPAWAA